MHIKIHLVAQYIKAGTSQFVGDGLDRHRIVGFGEFLLVITFTVML